MHNHEDSKQSKWMMLTMMLCCVLPILFIVLFSADGKPFGGSNWLIFGGFAIIMLAHFFMVGKSRKLNDQNDKTDKKDGNKPQSGHGCCH